MIKDNKILVNEIFESIDGEGYHAGRPTVFFRTVGCNLRCSWCFGPNQNGLDLFNPSRKSICRYPSVTLSDLSKKPLNEVKIGDVILTYKDKDCREIVETTVTDVLRHEVDSYNRLQLDNTLLNVTFEHPFMTKNKEWKEAITLKAKDKVIIASSKNLSKRTGHGLSKVRNNTIIKSDLSVIGISCAPYNTYLIDNIYVHNCDSTYTFKPEDTSKWMTVEQAVEEVEKFGWKHITITGGEPLMEENKSWMIRFMRTLQEKGYSIDVETNGSIDLEPYVSLFDELFANGKHDAMNEDRSFVTFIMDWKAPSSKMTTKMLPKNLLLLSDTDIVKVVCADDDFDTVLEVLKSGTVAQVYISPCFGKVNMEKLPEFIMKYGKEYPNLKMQIQLHKLCYDPEKRRV